MDERIETHPWTPFLPTGTRLLLLGSFPPPEKRWSMPFFYPNIQNDFWRIMGLIFYENRDYFLTDAGNADLDGTKKTKLRTKQRFNQDLCERFLIEQKIGVYDIARRVIRKQGNASDNFLEIVEPINLPKLLDQIPDCRTVAATGQKSLETIVSVLKAQNTNLTVPALDEYQSFLSHGRKLVLYRLPSTSRAYPKPLTEKANSYRKLLLDLVANNFKE